MTRPGRDRVSSSTTPATQPRRVPFSKFMARSHLTQPTKGTSALLSTPITRLSSQPSLSSHLAPGDPRNPAVLRFDSQYAAEAIQGNSDGRNNAELIRTCQQIYKTCLLSRQISWEWVKGHEHDGQAGNVLADQLAEKGCRNLIGQHSHRWATRHQHAITKENAETCRKCGRIFRDAHKCAAHQRGCDGENPVLDATQVCRKCGATLRDRKLRDAHEDKCTGNDRDNLKCQYCGKLFIVMHERIFHEGCRIHRPRTGLQGTLFWQCPCGWQIEKGKTTPKNSRTRKHDMCNIAAVLWKPTAHAPNLARFGTISRPANRTKISVMEATKHNVPASAATVCSTRLPRVANMSKKSVERVSDTDSSAVSNRRHYGTAGRP